MKATELRIGNLVRRVKTGEIMTVLAVDISTINQGGLAVEGIPLTEERLLKLGYFYTNENGQKSYWHGELPYFQLRNNGDSWSLWYEEQGDIEVLISKEDINFVHTLQNIFFALTGEELTINR